MTARRFTSPRVAAVRIEDDFWGPRQRQLITRTLDAQYAQLEATGRLAAFELTWQPGEPEPHPFWESDIAKWLEAASNALALEPDNAGLEAKVDRTIALLAGAQQNDGYLNVYFTVVRPGERFTDLRSAHELYGAGHLVEAAVAHHEATGKTTLLDVVRRYVDLIADVFGPGGARVGGYCGHEEIELALVRLARLTSERRYLDLARAFVDARGTDPYYFLTEQRRRGTPGYFGGTLTPEDPHFLQHREYNQSHLPVREQTEAVGHAVRAMYLYCALADLSVDSDDPTLMDACERLWEHLTTKRMYVTAGIGSSAHNEGFTRDYHLPNETAYAETCASIGLMMWARRMANITGQARYVEILERALYNGVIAGVSADGTKFFYENPLASDGDVERRDWFECACCPPNLARLEGSLGSYVYGVAEDAISVDLYIGSRASLTVAGREITLSQRVRYPLDGDIRFALEVPGEPVRFTLRLRVPDWARGARVSVNAEVTAAVVRDGYLEVDREWVDGDRVALSLDLAPRVLHANAAVSADAGRVALAHGPFVYCVEGVDHEVAAHALVLDLAAEPRVVVGDGERVARLELGGWQERSAGDVLYSEDAPERSAATITAVPYYSWNNRGRSSMAVWLRADRG